MEKKRNEYIERVLEKLFIPNEFGSDDSGYFHMHYEMERALSEALHLVDYNVLTGATKMVIDIRGVDEVIKIPFNGSIVESRGECSASFEIFRECDGDCLNCSRWEDAYDEFREFTEANDIEEGQEEGVKVNEWDYCLNELVKYKWAEKAGFADFFAKVEYHGLVDGHPVYLQERVSTFFHSNRPEPSVNANEAYNSLHPAIRCLAPAWIKHAIDYYGVERTADFLTFMMDRGLDDDMHNGNIGYTKEGKPVLLDWAGWRD